MKNTELEAAQTDHLGKATSTISIKDNAPSVKTAGKEVAEFLCNPVNCYTAWTVKKILPFIYPLLLILAQKLILLFSPQKL